jgi:rhomboid protease GluP
MAFGFSPNHVQDFQLNNLNKEQFLVLALESANKLGWKVSYIGENGFIAHTKFSWRSWSEEVTIKIENDIAHIESACTGSQTIDWGKNKKNIAQFLEKIDVLKNSMAPGEIEKKFVEISEVYDKNEEEDLSQPPPTSKENITGFFSFFKPTQGYYITPILVLLNILIFILMTLSGVHFLTPENQDLLNWGANFRPITLEGEWWRLFTACFLHIGILHLLFNMYALIFIGIILEPYMGKTRFLAAYLISGIAASVASLWWHDLTISAGASGAIFGMYGVFLALLTTNIIDKSAKNAFVTSIVVFVGYNLLNGLKANSGIDNAAHIGGLLSGLIIGYAFVPSLKQFDNKKINYLTIAGLSIILFISSIAIYINLPNDIGKYEKEMEQFVANEEKALKIYNLPNATNEEILIEIENNGLRYWKENLEIIYSLDNLDLPEQIRERNSKLKEYCELRIKSYELIYKAIKEDNNKYDTEINNYNLKIENIVNELTENNK